MNVSVCLIYYLSPSLLLRSPESRLVDEEEDVTTPDGFWWWCLPLLMQRRALTLCLCQLWCVTAEWVTGWSLGESGGVWGESDVSLTLSRCASLQHEHSHKDQAGMAWLYTHTSSFSRAVKYYWAGVQLRRSSRSVVSHPEVSFLSHYKVVCHGNARSGNPHPLEPRAIWAFTLRHCFHDNFHPPKKSDLLNLGKVQLACVSIKLCEALNCNSCQIPTCETPLCASRCKTFSFMLFIV